LAGRLISLTSIQFYRGGFLFECTRPKKRKEVIATGGRYDYLLEHFTPPDVKGLRKRTYGVGMSIDVE
jgi:translation initiation factor 2-alpha kinase 4